MQYVTLRVLENNGAGPNAKPTNFALDDLKFLAKDDRAPGVRRVETAHPFGVYRCLIEDDDEITILSEPDPTAATLV